LEVFLRRLLDKNQERRKLMGRIRTIKPEFPQSENIGKLSRDSRLLYIQLWTIADDSGRARAASRMLASLLYPYDDDARDLIDRWLDELEGGGHIRRYDVGGSYYLEIVKWLEHQKIDKPSASRLPSFDAGSPIVREDSTTDLGPVPRTIDPDQGSSTSASPPVSSRFDEFWKEYPKRDGDNPRKPAEKKFNALVKTGVDPGAIIAGAKQAAADARRRQIYATKYVPQAIKWLNDQRFLDCAAQAFADEPERMDWDAVLSTFQRTKHWSRWAGPDPESPACRAPPELLAKYGLSSAQESSTVS
jgi:hypothetical protein